MSATLEAADGLTLRLDSDGAWHLAWRDPDWLGPIELRLAHAGRTSQTGRVSGRLPVTFESFDGSDDLGCFRGVHLCSEGLPLPIAASARAYTGMPLVVFRLEAAAAIEGLGRGAFARPSVAWPAFSPAERVAGGAPEGARSYGHQYTEFALPVSGDALCSGYFFAPHRPPVVQPLMLVAPGGRTLMLAPLNEFHEQIIAVPEDREHAADGVRCGWHGDLEQVPAGFATEIAVWAAEGPRRALGDWAAALRRRHGTQRPSRYADDLLAKLSYWTDNGAVYYYRTEAGCDYPTTLERVVEDLRQRRIPVQSVQIDSWFYPHRHPRPVSPEGAPLVPPSGMMTWEPRSDILPDGFADLRRRLGGLPLSFHSRHFSSESPYFDRFAAWRDGDYAHPADTGLFDLLLAEAASWGAITYEQDWMVESFLGVRGLRQVPGRARAWQEALDRAAGEQGLTLQWCMSTPADMMQTLALRHVASVRTSGDYRYLFDNGLNWVWFLQTNALARALGLNPYKDVFLSHGDGGDGLGEPYAEVESLLSALSAGPVGIGDRLGRSVREIVMRTCREDGVLVKPDVPIAALERCFLGNAFAEHVPLIGEAYSDHPAGRWWYVATFNASNAKRRLDCRVELSDLGASAPRGAVMLYDWRRQTWQRLEEGGGWDCSLEFQDWDYRVVCPLLAGGIAVLGDADKYATAGDRRLAHIAVADGVVSFDVLGVAGTQVEVAGWSQQRPSAVRVWTPDGERVLAPSPQGEGWSWEASGAWRIRLHLGEIAWAQVRVKM